VEVQGTASGSPYSFLVDTGSVYTTLEPAILNQTHASHYFTGRGISLPYGGIRSERIVFGKALGIKLETQDMSDLVVGFAETGRHDYGLVHDYGGLIGADLLFRRHAIIDLGNRALYLMADKKK
jgi:hypothetical protein